MQTLHVFGYGSLVNRATHDFTQVRTARLADWRRVWVFTSLRPVAYLSVEPAAGAIDGLLAEVPVAGRSELDRREAAYDLHPVRAETRGAGIAAQVYAVAPRHIVPLDSGHRLLLSYIDTVAQGFFDHFGEAGAAHFFASTGGWQVPVIDDRAAPRYTRARPPTRWQRDVIDAHLAALKVRVVRA